MRETIEILYQSGEKHFSELVRIAQSEERSRE
jgi:hypothetical protein